MRVPGVVVAVFLTLACCRHRPSTSNEGSIHVEPDPAATTDVDPTQARIADAFYRTITPHLKACWPDAKEGGEIEFKFTYHSKEDHWALQQLELDASPLPAGVTAAALQCMRDAARGSTFPLEPRETAAKAKRFVITWGWPVPLPADTSTLARMMTDGHGCPFARCWACRSTADGKKVCHSSCSGGASPCSTLGGSGCAVILPECANGWSGPRAMSTAVGSGQPAGGVAPPQPGP